MIHSLAHATIYVKDHEEALKFYTETLGFEVRTDMTLDGFRWLTVAPKDQKEVELVLMEPKAGMLFDEESAGMLQKLLVKGALGAGVFATKDCRKTHQELKDQGVEFLSEPEEKPYGVEATFKDNSGNWFSLVEQR